MLRHIDFTPEHYRVSDFLNWAEAGVLRLNPGFQRRPVWNASQKSYFIDTLVRGYPVPQLIVRERVDLKSASTIREIVDGQQRLRTVLGFIRPSAVHDFDARRDTFVVREIHNVELAGATFSEIAEDHQKQILGFRFNVLILPDDTDDSEVLRVFARMNSTGVKLNAQELRNAEYSGPFKIAMYDLAFEQLDRWRMWRVFSDSLLARMAEVEFTSELAGLILVGIQSGSKKSIDDLYKQYEPEFSERDIVIGRLRRTLDAIDDRYGSMIPGTPFRRRMHFYGLFALVYDCLYGIGSDLRGTKPKLSALPPVDCVKELALRLSTEDVPPNMLKAMSGAANDKDRRVVRIEWMASLCRKETP